jgi:uncharacterized SAM-binding protein YcdF (DUF218 family)
LLTNRRLLILAVGVILFGFLTATGTALFIYNYGQTDRATPSDAIIVLGAGTRIDGSPNRALLRRTRHAASLYKRGLATSIICTGGYTNGHPKSEAQACAEVLIREGVPDTAILRDDVSTNTMENVIEARKVMDARNLKTAIIVSDSYHLFRAEWLFREYSMTVTLSPAQATQGRLSFVNAAMGTYREVGSLILNALRIVTSDYRESGRVVRSNIGIAFNSRR